MNEITFFNTALLDSLQLAKPKSKLIIKAGLSHATPTQTSSNSTSIKQNPPSKPMTSLVQSMSQQSGSAAKNQNYKILNPSVKYKFNNGIDTASTITGMYDCNRTNVFSNYFTLRTYYFMIILH